MVESVPSTDKSQTSLKRSPTPENTVRKKVRLGFTASEFRKQIKSEQKTQALQKFLQFINEGEHDVIITYLEGGGSVIEILQLIEGDSGAPPLIIFDIVNQILLQISIELPQYQNSAYDACRYFLNNFIMLINKMIGLSSSSKERLVTLKLLTTIVTCSVVLAKEVLLHVNFNPTNLELLTKFSEVRTTFIHFITAFLVGGHFPTLSVLLEKKGLMTSIVRGLQYDESNVVVLVLTSMKNHILENGFVTKTTKMKTFNTPVVRDIVNLYNWKGPAGLVNLKNKTNSAIVVDEIEKSNVNEAVHSFLLVLCTSHKHGVIFKDPLIGLGKSQNSLMHTVLESLERPWEHSYASELVLKICRACPDLVKTMWLNLGPFLEPRWTEKWVKSVQFAERLLEEMQPECIEANNLNVHQITQVITVMTSPLPILKILIPENVIFEQLSIKHKIISLTLNMLKSIEKYLKHFKNDILRKKFESYIAKNFPNVEFILKDWDQSDLNCSVSEYLDIALDLLDKYKILAPKTLFDCNLILDLKDFISKSENLNEGLKIKAVNFFIALEPTQFRPKSDLFQTVLTFSMEYYYCCKDTKALKVLHLLLKNSGIFDGYESEIDFWIDGILNQRNYDESIPIFVCNLIQKVDESATKYNKKLNKLQNSNFSCMVLGLMDFEQEGFSKIIKNYLGFVLLNIFHTQIDSTCFIEVVLKFQFLPILLTNYFENWNNSIVTVLGKCKGVIMEHFSKFSNDFLESSVEGPIPDLYPNFKLNLLQSLMFYLTNLIETGTLREKHKKNCEFFFEQLFNENLFDEEVYIKTILGNRRLLQTINLHSPNDFSSNLVINFVKHVKSQFVEIYLEDLREKIVTSLTKIFRKPHKYENSNISIEILETVGLDSKQCKKLVSKFVTTYDNKIFLNVLSYCLNRLVELNLEGLECEVVAELSKFLTYLIKQEVPNLSHFSSSLHNYLKTFPESINSVKSELFGSLIKMSEFNKDNLALSEFLFDRSDCWSIFHQNLDEICSKKGFILALLDVVIKKTNDDVVLENIFKQLESHITKILQKPHKAGQHFQNRYTSVGILIEKFMNPGNFGTQIQKFETTELFHVYLLKKVFDKVENKEKNFKNMIMTFIHLLVNLLKQKKEHLEEIGQIFYEFLIENENVDVILSNNETFKTFCKLCLKHGVSGEFILLRRSSQLVRFCQEEDAKLMLDMLMSHSQFLDVVLGVQKNELLNLWLSLCSKWPLFMERNHVPILLSAYKATKGDTVALKLLKMYESKPAQTKFFDFKPFLWGRAAVSHYSVRSDIQKALWRQPKMADVLNNLHLATITSTITDPLNETSYDLDYFLPLFSHLLSPENPVTTYHFTKSGALALTIVGLTGDKSQRLATCHVLQRFYFHLEARQSGKDTLLWLRFIEAICKGIAVFDDFQINNFVGVFLARMALILAQPAHIMYVPLTQYLSAKDSLDFSTVPELYTFLHSPHVDSKEHKHFILEVLRDGLKNEKDFGALLRSMGFKLISELFSSTVCDQQTKILILEVFEKCCRIKLGIGILCGSLSFLAQMFCMVLKERQEGIVLMKLLNILLTIVEVDSDRHRNFIVFLNLVTLVENEVNCQYLKESKCVIVYFKILSLVYQKFPNFFTTENVDILKKLDDKLCKEFVKK